MITSQGSKTSGKKRQLTRMNSWDDTEARMDATWAFCDYLEAHPEKRSEIMANPAVARETMAKVGNFYLAEEMPKKTKGVTPIPADAEFRVFDFNPREKRDKLITIVVPPQRIVGEDPTEVWRCSWPPWLQ